MDYILSPMLEDILNEKVLFRERKTNKDRVSVHIKASGPVIKSTEDVLEMLCPFLKVNYFPSRW